MGDLGVFVDRQLLSASWELDSIIKLRDVAESMGHRTYFIFPAEIKKVDRMDALFIRSRTDPMNICYVASRLAEFRGIPVIDDPHSIRVCSDKINMYMHLMRGGVPIPHTEFFGKGEATPETASRLFEELGNPLVLKEPSTSFSVRVEKVSTEEEFLKVSRRFIKLSDWIVAQQYIESAFDWRVGVLDGQMLYACRYIIPPETFKIQASVNGHLVYCTVECVRSEDVPPEVVRAALDAGEAIGRGLFGVDLKQSEAGVHVIEVNDNPCLSSGEDQYYPDVYGRIIGRLMGG